MAEAIVVAEGIVVPPEALRFRGVRSGGPGGQNVNKVASKVELRVDLGLVVGLSDGQRSRLLALAGRRLGADGELVVTSQRTRDQAKNLADARAKVRALVLSALPDPKRRRPTRPTAGARARRLDEKHRAGERKRLRARTGTSD